MIWLTWRQHRIEMLVLGLMLALIAAFLVHSGLPAYIAYYQVVQGTSVATCMLQHRQDALCQTLNNNFYMNFSARNFFGGFLRPCPAAGPTPSPPPASAGGDVPGSASGSQ